MLVLFLFFVLCYSLYLLCFCFDFCFVGLFCFCYAFSVFFFFLFFLYVLFSLFVFFFTKYLYYTYLFYFIIEKKRVYTSIRQDICIRRIIWFSRSADYIKFNNCIIFASYHVCTVSINWTKKCAAWRRPYDRSLPINSL